MFEVFKSTLNPLLMMFTFIIIGFILNKKKLIPENSDKVLSKVETYVLVPALNISTFMKYCTVPSILENSRIVITSLILTCVAIIIAYPLSRIFSKENYQRNIYKYALTFGNFGFMGNAIVPVILGEEYLYPYMLFTLPLNLTCYVWGLALLIPKKETASNPFKNLINPCVFGILIGAFLGLTGVSNAVPEFLKLSLEKLGACMGPIAMILTGFVVANYDFKNLIKKPYVYLATLFRLIIFPVVFLTALIALKADALTVKMCLFAFATPLGLNTVVFPSAYGGDAATGASMALISHTLCVITIPILYLLISLFL